MSDPIIVVPYDPGWPKRFRGLALPIRQALGVIALRIDHIGSTSIVGMDAKPVIDMQISVAALEPVDTVRDPLARLGYVFHPENDELTKRYFREPAGLPRTHIHVRRLGSWAEQFALLFRDYMRANPNDARAYAELKHALAQRYRDDRDGYTTAKEPFIWEAMWRADRWSQRVGWQAGDWRLEIESCIRIYHE